MSMFGKMAGKVSGKAVPNDLGFTLQQTMLRIKDPKRSVPFYEKNFGFQLLHQYDFPQWNFSLYFMGIPKPGTVWPKPGTKASEDMLWSMKFESCLELTHNHGSENDPDFKVNNGNVEPHRGFGHIAVMTPDVQAACDVLEANGCDFQKKPNEGRMKGLAFVKDPDGYWIEVISRSPDSVVPPEIKFTLAQTMQRIKDPSKSIPFYRDVLKMTLLRESHFSDFSLYFLAQIPPGEDLPDEESGGEYIRRMYPQVLELTHNHGTENNPDFNYHNGNLEDKEKGIYSGFGHTGFIVDDLTEAVKYLDECKVPFRKRPEDGGMRELAFVLDPDGYSVEIIQKNGFKLATED
jgi:lactoylglutathione lyase